MAILIMGLSLRSIKTNNWSAINFKKHVSSMSCTLRPSLQSGDTGQRQLSIDHNMDVHKDVHYQVKHRLYIPWTPSW